MTDIKKLAKCLCGNNEAVWSRIKHRVWCGACGLVGPREMSQEKGEVAWNQFISWIETGRAVHKKAEDLAGEWQIDLDAIISLCETGQNPCVKCRLHRAPAKTPRWQDVMGELRDVIAVPLSVAGLDKRLLLAKIDAVFTEPEEKNDGKE